MIAASLGFYNGRSATLSACLRVLSGARQSTHSIRIPVKQFQTQGSVVYCMNKTPTHPKNVRIRNLLAASLIAATYAGYASTDYGPANWYSSCNANYYTSGYGHKFVVCHDMEGYYASVISMFGGCGWTASSIHYLVNGKQDATSDYAAGALAQMVRESNYAWHVVCWNSHCHGTEHEGFASNPAWYTDAMYNTTGDLQQHLCDKFGIAKDRNHVIGHDEWQNSAWRTYAANSLGIDPNCNTHHDPGAYWDWSKLMGIVKGNSSQSTAGPDAVSWGSSRIDVVARGAGNAIYHRVYTSTGWGAFNSIGGDSTSGPSVSSWGSGRLDIFTRGADDTLMHRAMNNNGWQDWQSLGGNLEASPDAVSWGTDRIDVVVRANGNNIMHRAYHNSVWDDSQYLGGGNAGSAPSICSWAAGRLDVFYRGTDNALYHQGYNDTGWLGWQNLGGNIVGGPDAVSWGPGRMDVVVRGPNNDILHRAFHDGAWDTWQSLGGNSASDPGISSWGPSRLDVFYVAANGELWHRAYNSSGWQAWQNMGGSLQ